MRTGLPPAEIPTQTRGKLKSIQLLNEAQHLHHPGNRTSLHLHPAITVIQRQVVQAEADRTHPEAVDPHPVQAQVTENKLSFITSFTCHTLTCTLMSVNGG